MKEKPGFGTVRSEGTEARVFVFTGKLLSKHTSAIPFYGRVTEYLYELPNGSYRVIYEDGNVSLPMSAEGVRTEFPTLARKANIVKVIHLDDESD